MAVLSEIYDKATAQWQLAGGLRIIGVVLIPTVLEFSKISVLTLLRRLGIRKWTEGHP